ncbi:hypothetical protein B0O99DRAFT_613943 [Bisporella sp. PMI_857]|nr:hypothetical protein B0O99DRAFT_613943 [Bisporella sp. PMI_857]
MDASCGTMPTHHRRGPVSLVVSDIKVMLRNTTRCLPEMVRSLWTADLGRSIVGSLAAMDIMDISLQIMLGFLELCMITTAIPAFMMLPGLILVPIALICAMVIMLLCWPLNGEQVIRCSRCSGRPSDDMMAEERWFHINGSMTR